MTTRQRAARMITAAQSRKLFALYRQIGITDRAKRLAHIAGYLGIDSLASSNDLSLDEAKMLIDRLEQLADEPVLVEPDPFDGGE